MKAETQEWHDYAADDFRIARLLLAPASVSVRGTAFHAQQAAEKAIKAVLVERGMPFQKGQKGHDLAYLAQILPPGAPAFDRRDLDFLSTFAVHGRYPDNLVLPALPEAERAVEIAARVVAAVEALLS